MPAGNTLAAGDLVTSPNGQYRLVAQSDSNLAGYGIGGSMLWSSATSNQPGAVAVAVAVAVVGKN